MAPKLADERPPEPPVTLPPGRTVQVPGRGELFVRDSGGAGPPVLLLHGWMFHSDLNWWTVYGPLAEAGYRVLALDARGHGRGLRSPERFSLEACAGDAAAVVRTLGLDPVVAVGYSLGGPIAQLMARDHPDAVRGLVMSATSREWRAPYLRALWQTMAGFRLLLGLFPTSYWQVSLRLSGFPDTPLRSWMAAELTRGSARDISDAGRDLGRYDSRPWIASLPHPAAVILTTNDRQVFPRKQRALAAALRAPIFEVDDGHFAVTASPRAFNHALQDALTDVLARTEARTEPAQAA